MGDTWKKWLMHFQKWVTLAKLGHSWKDGSDLENSKHFKTRGHSAKNWVTINKKGNTWKPRSHMGKRVYHKKKGHVKKTMSHSCEKMFHLKKMGHTCKPMWVLEKQMNILENMSHKSKITSLLKKNGSHLKDRPMLKKWVKLNECVTLKNRSQVRKSLLLAKIGHTCKNGSHLKKKCFTLETIWTVVNAKVFYSFF